MSPRHMVRIAVMAVVVIIIEVMYKLCLGQKYQNGNFGKTDRQILVCGFRTDISYSISFINVARITDFVLGPL